MTEQELRTEIADEYGDDHPVRQALLALIQERDWYRQQLEIALDALGIKDTQVGRTILGATP